MKINLITPEEYAMLLEAYANHPILTLQNKGYETPDKSKMTEADLAKHNEISTVLKKAIVGFSSFTNFRLNKNDEIEIRLQYNYNYEPNSGIPFTGVGYILLDELLNGFKK